MIECYKCFDNGVLVCTCPGAPEPTSRSVWKEAHEDFAGAMRDRMARGEARFGRELWLEQTKDRHITDIQEELVDAANYLTFLWAKLEKLRDDLDTST